jgi:hypothetical protein
MAQEPSSKDLLEAVKQQESGGRRYKADGKTLLEGPQTKYGTAKGEMQVLDMTNKDPGYGVKPAQDDSPDERARVGRDYLRAMVNKYGDKKTALVAYNWGPGNTDKWLDKGGDFSKLPKETQNYVTKITGALGSTKLAQAPAPATPKTKPKSGLQQAVYKAAPLSHPMLSMMGPNYQAAMAVSMLADEDEKEGKSEYEPSESEKMLTEATARPVALSQVDLGYQSPFPELNTGIAGVQKQPVKMAAGGVPYMPTVGIRPSARAQLNDVKAQWDAFNTKATDYNTKADEYNRQVADYQKLVDAYNAGPRTEDFTGKEPTFTYTAPTEPTVSADQYQGMADAAKKDVARRSMALSVASNPEQYGLSMNKFFADGGQVSAPYGGEVDYFQDPMGVPDSGPITADTLAKGKEFKAADALKAVKEVGRGVAKNVKAVAQGVSETPYNLVGGVADVGNLALTPFGLGSKEPMLGSEHLKRLALEAGIRQAPPTNPQERGMYMMGELGSSVVNPGPIAAKGGKAAEMLAKDFQAYNQALGPAGVAYAVKPKGGAFTGTREYEYTPSGSEGREVFEDSVTSLIKSGELMPVVRPELKIPIQSRNALNGWIEDKIGNYIRRDMATTNDPFVKAVDEGKKLHLLEGLGDIKPMSNLARRRDRQGFPAWGSAKTPLGRKLEKQIDSSMWSEDIGDVDTYNMYSKMESFKDTDPNMQIYTPGAQIANRMQFPKMIEGMEDMLTEKRYTAYGDTSTPIPQEYQLTPEKLQGMSPVDASEKVGLFNQWRDKERQVQAAQYLDKYGNTYKKYDNGRKWVAMDDLAEEPKQAELVQQAGCLGGWCTKEESFAMDNGSGDNRLHILFDEKAVPRVQLTVTKSRSTADDFINNLEYDEFNQFEQSHGKASSLPTWLIESTPEYQAWARTQDNPERITELKGQFNKLELAKDPNSRKYLKEVQDFVKSKNWGSVANLDGINMIDLDDYLPPIARGLNLEQTNQLSDFMKSLNGGSRFADKYEGENIVREAAMRAFQPPTPPGRATGGMVERQTSAAQYI